MQLFLAAGAPAAEMHASKQRSSFLRMSKTIRPIVARGCSLEVRTALPGRVPDPGSARSLN